MKFCWFYQIVVKKMFGSITCNLIVCPHFKLNVFVYEVDHPRYSVSLSIFTTEHHRYLLQLVVTSSSSSSTTTTSSSFRIGFPMAFGRLKQQKTVSRQKKKLF